MQPSLGAGSEGKKPNQEGARNRNDYNLSLDTKALMCNSLEEKSNQRNTGNWEPYYR